jgi:hypothetical protein
MDEPKHDIGQGDFRQAPRGMRAVACRQACLAGRHSPVKPPPRKLKGPDAFARPAQAISTKNKHLLVIYSIPTRGFTAAVSVFGGTPPAKPFDCKIGC